LGKAQSTPSPRGWTAILYGTSSLVFTSTTCPPPPQNNKSARDPQRHPGPARDLGEDGIAHRLGGEGRLFPRRVQRGHDELVGHAAPALPAAAAERGHRGRWRGGGGVRVRVGGGRVGFEDVGEGQPGRAVDREPVGLAAAGRHRRRPAGETGGSVAVVAGGARGWRVGGDAIAQRMRFG